MSGKHSKTRTPPPPAPNFGAAHQAAERAIEATKRDRVSTWEALAARMAADNGVRPRVPRG